MWTEEYKKQYHKDYHRTWYEKNKEKRKIQLKEYAQNHKEDSVRRTQKYVAKNKKKVYAYGHGYNSTPSGEYRIYKNVATRKGKEFLLSLEDFSQIKTKSCIYCGEDKERRGIDRIDNSLGYTRENSAPCCQICNYMKKNYSVEKFISHVKKIYLHNN